MAEAFTDKQRVEILLKEVDELRWQVDQLKIKNFHLDHKLSSATYYAEESYGAYERLFKKWKKLHPKAKKASCGDYDKW